MRIQCTQDIILILAMVDFVNRKVKDLLANGIIRHSRSPYNNRVWVVDKKGIDSDGTPKRHIVIDFRELNLKTVSDRYPIPHTSVILANPGKVRFFTTLDLKSEFHQIMLREQDREKTAFIINNRKFEFCILPFGVKTLTKYLRCENGYIGAK